MKKNLIYMVTAILLGTVSMLFPFLITFPGEAPGLARAPPPAPEAYAEDMQKRAEVEGVTFSSSLKYAGFIIILGFFIALGVSQYFKRRII